MPTAQEILAGLERLAVDWRGVAILWHVYFGFVLAAALSGVRATCRLWGAALALPTVSVSALAWATGNPFNGGVFALLAVLLLALAPRLRPETARLASTPWLAAGAALAGFGWIYPHFLEAGTRLAYLYAAPLGLVPCPTLSMLTGVSLMLGGLGSTWWAVTTSAAGLFYGLFGALYLGVTIDWVLAAGAAVLLAQTHLKMWNAG